jgi:acyl-lipid omega-6 desaturase (Delta-12 desaturase)
VSGTLKAIIPSECRERQTGRGLYYFAISALAYALSFATLAWLSSPVLRIPLVLLNGLAIAILFVVGHDACHGALTPSARANYVISQLSFLPSLHPFTGWSLSHNTLHHAWANLREHDPGYPPYTVEEFSRLSRWRQLETRVHRTFFGVTLMYLSTVWWPYMVAPSKNKRVMLDKVGNFGRERVWVVAYLAFVVAIAIAAGVAKGSSPLRASVEEVAWIVIGPFLVFGWLIAWATYLHHTHPQVRWYDSQTEWREAQAQLTATVHVVFPRWAELMLHEIMQHPAHHVDPNVPFYSLANAERALEHTVGHQMVVMHFTVRDALASLRICRLYDYKTHTWHDWDGTPLQTISVRG